MKNTGLIKFLLIIFIGYALFNYNKIAFNNSKNEIIEQAKFAKSVIEEAGKVKQPDVSIVQGANASDLEKTLGSYVSKVASTPKIKGLLEHIQKKQQDHKMRLDEIKKNGVYLLDVKAGTGDPAKKADKVFVAYTAVSTVANLSKMKKNELLITIGDKKLLEQLESAIVGMKPGGVRQVYFNAPNGKGMLCAEVVLKSFG